MIETDMLIEDYLIEGVMGSNPDDQDACTRSLRERLSRGVNPPVQQVIDAGVVPRFIEFLQEDKRPNLQHDTAWALTNIVCGTNENTRFVVDCGAVPFLVELITSPNDEVREQVVWALANISADCPAFRDIVLKAGALTPILDELQRYMRDNIRGTYAWALLNLCRGKPGPNLEMAEKVFPVVAQLIYNEVELDYRDEEILYYACQALGCIISVFAGSGDIFQNMIKTNILPILDTFLFTYAKGAAIAVFAGMMAGDNDQIQTVFDSNHIPKIISFMREEDIELRKNATKAITNAFSCGSNAQARYLIDQGCIRTYCDLLSQENDHETMCIALEGLENIFKVVENETIERFLLLIEADGLMRLQGLSNLSSKEISEKVSNLVVKNLLMLVS